jgi:hypothetical protein
MKTKIINSDKPGLTDNDILQTKPSFNSLYSKFVSFPAKVFFSKGLFYWVPGVVVVSTAVILLVLNANKGNDQKDLASQNGDTLKNKSFVEAPIKSVAINYKECTFDAAKGSQITTCRGSKIIVPENAFVYNDGTPVKGEVTFKYREFNNPVEIFQSGIPMQYDSAKTKYMFESAGMIELIALKNNKNVSLAKGKTIDVALKSDNNENRFNVYYLDTVKKNWVYQGRDLCINNQKPNDRSIDAKPVVSKENKINTNQVFKSDTASLIHELIKPVLASKNAIVFKVDYNTKDFPELSVYQNLLFEVNDKSVVFNKDWYTINWDKILLKHTKNKDLYLVTLQKRDSTVNFTARPVFNKTQYESALKIYTENQKPAQKTNTVRPVSQISATTLTGSFVSGLGDEKATTRVFKVANMGIWNCDQPIPFSNFNRIANASFKDANSGIPIDCKAIYVATLKANILLQFSAISLGYSTVYDNVCFVVTFDEKIGIINPTDFKNTLYAGRTAFATKVYTPIEGIKELKNWIDPSI